MAFARIADGRRQSLCIGSLPKRSCSANQPSTAPGTLTGNGPMGGMSREAEFLEPFQGQRFRANGRSRCSRAASWSSDPRRWRTGRRRCRCRSVPSGPARHWRRWRHPPRCRPASSRPSAICVASGCEVAAIACGAMTSERVAKSRPVMRSAAVAGKHVASSRIRNGLRYCIAVSATNWSGTCGAGWRLD